jgi:hypothetical protein
MLAPSSDGRVNGKCRVEVRIAGGTQVHSGLRLFDREMGNPEQLVKCSIARWNVRRGIVWPSRKSRMTAPGPDRPAGSDGKVGKGVKMMKGCLTTAAVLAILAVGAQAGEIKTHEWPCQFVALEITSIPVVMDVGYYVRIKNQDSLRIKLVQDEQDIHTFKGCTDMTVESNFNLTLSASISKTGAIDGSYSVTLNPTDANAGSTTVQVCATLKNANLTGQPAGTKDVQVATVKIKVKPR